MNERERRAEKIEIKYYFEEIREDYYLKMPKGARIISVHPALREYPYKTVLWAEVDPNAELEIRHFKLYHKSELQRRGYYPQYWRERARMAMELGLKFIGNGRDLLGYGYVFEIITNENELEELLEKWDNHKRYAGEQENLQEIDRNLNLQEIHGNRNKIFKNEPKEDKDDE